MSKRIKRILHSIATNIVQVVLSWHVIGLVGWWIICRHYPLQAILPRYAG